MEGVSKVDEKRRIVLPKKMIDKLGEEFVIIQVDGDIILKPMPKDPIAALQEEGKKFKGVGWRQIRRDFEKALIERSRKNSKS